MIRDLPEEEMDTVLRDEWYGHLACQQRDGYPYVLPFAFVYRHHCLYTYSFEGTKIDLMRRNPKVCFQTETLIGSDEWKSVIVWGKFEELSGGERDEAHSIVFDALWKDASQGIARLLPFRDSPEAMEKAMKDDEVVLFRIRIERMAGRHEKYE
jgi:uncharacterized protein